MILEHQHDLSAFREAVRSWINQTVTPEVVRAARCAKGAEQVAVQKWWMQERAKVGLATPHWPKEYGGADLGLPHQVILADELARGQTPSSDCFVIGLNHLPGTLIPFGSERQKSTYLPTVANGVIWCQGFSEPSAGSDLANLKTRAERVGDQYIINGQKTWSSYSMYARYAILLARTDFGVKKQRGITYFILDMQAPGVDIRPIRKSTGKSEFAELFLTDVAIPIEDRVGEEGQGWEVAQATLSSERGVLAFEATEREHAFLQEFYEQSLSENAPWLQDASLRRDFMRWFSDHQALRRQIRELLRAPADHGGWSMAPALIKLSRSTLRNNSAALRVGMAGYESQFLPPDDAGRRPMTDYLESFASTIAAGSNEIMRNLIAERGLGMPR